jgi:hypothetical protein
MHGEHGLRGGFPAARTAIEQMSQVRPFLNQSDDFGAGAAVNVGALALCSSDQISNTEGYGPSKNCAER